MAVSTYFTVGTYIQCIYIHVYTVMCSAVSVVQVIGTLSCQKQWLIVAPMCKALL
jgi:hypothetical protein